MFIFFYMHRIALLHGQWVIRPLIYFLSWIFFKVTGWAGWPCNPAGRVRVGQISTHLERAVLTCPSDPWVGTGQPITRRPTHITGSIKRIYACMHVCISSTYCGQDLYINKRLYHIYVYVTTCRPFIIS